MEIVMTTIKTYFMGATYTNLLLYYKICYVVQYILCRYICPVYNIVYTFYKNVYIIIIIIIITQCHIIILTFIKLTLNSLLWIYIIHIHNRV